MFLFVLGLTAPKLTAGLPARAGIFGANCAIGLGYPFGYYRREMEFFQRAAGAPSHLGILPGTFNPVTVAHLALAEAALRSVDEVLFVLPRAFPHKPYTGASFEDRVEMLKDVARPRYSVAASDGGLFFQIAGECRKAYHPDTRLTFLCGRDAAERIVGWNYDDPGALQAMLRSFSLLVAARSGEYVPPAEWAGCIARLDLENPLDHVSATEVRERIARGEPWRHLVPEAVGDRVARIYG